MVEGLFQWYQQEGDEIRVLRLIKNAIALKDTNCKGKNPVDKYTGYVALKSRSDLRVTLYPREKKVTFVSCEILSFIL